MLLSTVWVTAFESVMFKMAQVLNQISEVCKPSSRLHHDQTNQQCVDVAFILCTL